MGNSKKVLNVCSDSAEYIDTIKGCEAAVSLFSLPGNLLVVCKSDDCLPSTIDIGTPFLNDAGRPYSRILLLFTKLPIKLALECGHLVRLRLAQERLEHGLVRCVVAIVIRLLFTLIPAMADKIVDDMALESQLSCGAFIAHIVGASFLPVT